MQCHSTHSITYRFVAPLSSSFLLDGHWRCSQGGGSTSISPRVSLDCPWSKHWSAGSA